MNVAGTEPEKANAETFRLLDSGGKRRSRSKSRDGSAAARMVVILVSELA
jgi:hypothetical protein